MITTYTITTLRVYEREMRGIEFREMRASVTSRLKVYDIKFNLIFTRGEVLVEIRISMFFCVFVNLKSQV